MPARRRPRPERPAHPRRRWMWRAPAPHQPHGPNAPFGRSSSFALSLSARRTVRTGSLPGGNGCRHRFSDRQYRLPVSEDGPSSFPPPGGPPFVPPSGESEQPGSRGRHGWLIGGGLVALALGGGVVALLLTRGDGADTGSPPQSSIPEITFPPPTTSTSTTLPDASDLSLPTLPEFSLPSVPDLSLPDLPDLSLPDLPDITFPDFTIPETTVPDLIPAPTGEPDGLGTDPALDVLAERCYGADMPSCDDLYQRAPAGPEYERYGAKGCGRQPEHTRRYCTDVFAN